VPDPAVDRTPVPDPAVDRTPGDGPNAHVLAQAGLAQGLAMRQWEDPAQVPARWCLAPAALRAAALPSVFHHSIDRDQTDKESGRSQDDPFHDCEASFDSRHPLRRPTGAAPRSAGHTSPRPARRASTPARRALDVVHVCRLRLLPVLRAAEAPRRGVTAAGAIAPRQAWQT